MNTTSISPSALAMEPRSEAAGSLARIATFGSQVRQQIVREIAHLRLGLLFVWTSTALQFLGTLTSAESVWKLPIGLSDAFAEVLVPFLMALSVLADAPASTRAQIHTLPVQRSAHWLAKLLVAAVGLALPTLLGDMAVRSSFAYGWQEWAWFVVGDAFILLNLLFVPAAIASLADHSGRAIVYGALWAFASVVVTGGGNFALDEWGGWRSQDWSPSLETCQEQIAWMLVGLLSLAAWSVMVLSRKRRCALLLLAVATLQPLILLRVWQKDWHQAELQRLPAGQLTLAATAPTSTTGPRGQALWPGLELRGLAPGQMATIVAMCPDSPDLLWPGPAGCWYSDFEARSAGYGFVTGGGRARVGPGVEQARIVASHYPAGIIWADSDTTPGRLALNALLSRQTRPTTGSFTWRIWLRVQSMRKVADLPLTEFIAAPQSFALSPGLRMDTSPPLSIPDRARALNWRVTIQRNWPLLAPDAHHVLGAIAGRASIESFQVICHDTVNNECVAQTLQMPMENSIEGIASYAKSITTSLEIAVPLIRLDILKQTVRDWVPQARVQVWVAVDEGMAEVTASSDLLDSVK